MQYYGSASSATYAQVMFQAFAALAGALDLQIREFNSPPKLGQMPLVGTDETSS